MFASILKTYVDLRGRWLMSK